MRDEKKVANNIVMLYLLNFAQLLLPLITLPYLTRVLSLDGYGVVSYVKSLMTYISLIIEFGYLLSGTREVVQNKNNSEKLNRVVGKVLESKLMLSFFAFGVLLVMIKFIPILHRHFLFTLLSFGTPFLSIFLFDFLFRGLEKMQILTARYVIMRSISTALTFIFVRGENDLNLIPLLDIIGSLVAVLWVHREIVKLGINIKFVSFSKVWQSLKVSFIYFISDMATTAFGALNTMCVGLFLSSSDVAFWGVTMSFVGAVQSMYSPISDGLYPRMVDKKSLHLFVKVILVFVPVLIIGALITYYSAGLIITVIGGHKYIEAAQYLQLSVPLLVISFFSILCGWPLLGSINRIKETTTTTVLTAILQIVGILILIWSHNFTIVSLLCVRTITECFLFLSRAYCAFKFRSEFSE